MHDNWTDEGKPMPYDEDNAKDKWWNKSFCGGEDPFDRAIPKTKSFVTDLVYYTRGMETPTIFVVWSAIFLIASVVKREAWLKWYPNRMFANIYVLFVGPASSKKSTVLDDIGIPMLQNVTRYINSPAVKSAKSMNIIKNKTTPEAMLQAMLPSGKQDFVKDSEGNPLQDSNGQFYRYENTSEVSIVLSEMSVTVSKRSYAEGIIQLLLDLYSTHDEWSISTVGRGVQKLKKLCTNFVGALTPTSFQHSIPEAAIGDGFLSRNIIAYQKGYPRVRPIPGNVEGAPTEVELTKRLAWIAENSLGEYSFSTEGYNRYVEWYYKFKQRLNKSGDAASSQSRLDLHVLKTAFLLRLARYEDADAIIEYSDVEDAIQLVEATFEQGIELINELAYEGSNEVENRLLERIIEKKELQRGEILRNMKIPSDEANYAITNLHAAEKIEVLLDDVPQSGVTRKLREVYRVSPEYLEYIENSNNNGNGKGEH